MQDRFANLAGRFADVLRGLRRVAVSRPASFLLLATLFWMVAAASYSGFVGKQGLREQPSYMGIIAMLDGTAQKPWVFRQLAPAIANIADREIPGSVKQRVVQFVQNHFMNLETLPPEATFVRVISDRDQYRFRYKVVYYLAFLSVFAALFVLRRICLDLGMGAGASLIAPAGFVLGFPYLQTVGGYFYDQIELLFTSLLFLFALRRRYGWFLAAATIGTLNKEALFFFIPMLYPIFRMNAGVIASRLITAASLAASGAVYLALQYVFRNAPGGGRSAYYRLLDNLHDYTSFWPYHQMEATYGVVGPSRLFAGTLLVIAIVVIRGWPGCPQAVKQHLRLAAVINVPLFLLFCAPGELRNLSLMFVGFVVLMASALAAALKGGGQFEDGKISPLAS